MAAPRYMIPKCSCLLQHGTNTQAPPAHVLPIIGAAYEVVGAAYEVIGAETEACTGAVTEPVATWAALTSHQSNQHKPLASPLTSAPAKACSSSA